MTVFYVDPLNGNDSNNGQSFANRRKTLVSYTSVTSNDEIRVIETTPTSLGNGTWTANSGTNTKPTDSSRQIASISITKANDSNPVSCSKTSHGLITGDIILRVDTTYYGFYAVTKVDDDNFTLDGTENQVAHSITSTSIYKVSEFCVKLANSPIKNILCSSGLSSTNGPYGTSGTGTSKPWTAVQGTTGTETSFYRSLRYSNRYFRPGNDATGKVAYCELDSTLDLSGYQQISLKYVFDYVASGQKNDSGIFSLRLCSDTQGDTVVNTIPITPPPGDDFDQFFWWTYDNGANLGSNINSVALYVDVETEHSNTEIILSNIIACKAKSAADSLHLGSLISKGTTFSSNYYAIDAIIDNIIVLQLNYGSNSTSVNNNNSNNNNLRHNETTGTVTTYKVDPYTPDPTFYHSGEDYQPNIININAGDLSCTISGGWNSTDMSTQTTNAMSWLSQFGTIYKSIGNSQTGSMSRIGEILGLVRIVSTESFGRDINASISDCHFIGQRIFNISNQVKVENCNIFGNEINTSYGYGSGGTLFVNCNFLNSRYSSEAGEPKYFTGCTFNGFSNNNLLVNVNDTNIFPEDLYDVEFANCTFKNLVLDSQDWQNRYRSLVNCSFDNFTLFYNPDYDRGVPNDRLPTFAFINYNNTANDHRFYYINGLITSDSSVTQSGSGYSWKFTALQNVTSVKSRLGDPIQFKLAEVAVVANAQVTASAYFRRTSTSSGNDVSGLALLTRPNLNLGITSDVKVLTDAAADTWQQVTLTFTPTVSGIATFHALLQMTSTSQNVYVDSFSVTQA